MQRSDDAPSSALLVPVASFYNFAHAGRWSEIEEHLSRSSSALELSSVLSALRYQFPGGYGGEGETVVHELLSAYEKPGGIFFNSVRGYRPPPPLLLSRLVDLCNARGYRILELRTSQLQNTFLRYAATHTDDVEVFKYLVAENPKCLVLKNGKDRRPIDSAEAWKRAAEVQLFLKVATDIAERIDVELPFEHFKFEFQMWEKI